MPDDATPTRQPWERLPEENNLWYDRFERYRMAGPTRSVLSIYNEEQAAKAARKGKSWKRRTTAGISWVSKSKEHRWQERAEAWDEYLRVERQLEDERKRANELEVARELRRKTIQALQAMLGRVIQAEQSGQYHVDARTLKYLSTAAATIFKESRLEFGEATDYTAIELKQEMPELTDEQLAAIAAGGTITGSGR